MVLAFIVFFFSLCFTSFFYIWMCLEVVFFFVMLKLSIKFNKSSFSIFGLVYYLLVQAFGSLAILSSFLGEVFYWGNYFMPFSCVSWFCWWSMVIGLALKLSIFPFYIQVFQVMSFISFSQMVDFLVYPKILPMLILYELGEDVGFFFCLSILTLFISGIKSIYSSNVSEVLSWSGLSQLSWLLMSVCSSMFVFFFFFFIYVSVLFGLVKVLSVQGKKLFFDFMDNKWILVFFLLGVSGLAPFLFFFLKLMILYFFFDVSFFLFLCLLLSSLSVFLFYVRIFQVLLLSSFVGCEVKVLKVEWVLLLVLSAFFLFIY